MTASASVVPWLTQPGILARQADKRRLADAIVQRDCNLLGQLTSRDLELLLA